MPWPSREKPYQTDHRFVYRGGNQIIDGRSYYPALMRLRFTPADALQIVESIVRQLNVGGGCVELDLSGELTEIADD